MRVRVYYWKDARWCSRVSFNEMRPIPREIKRDYGLVYDKDRPDLSGDDMDACEWLFHEFNTEDMIGQGVARAVGHTSMSVGDIIDLDGDGYIAEPVGFSKIELPVALEV